MSERRTTMQREPSKISSVQKKESRIQNTKVSDTQDVHKMDMSTISAISSPRRRIQSHRQSMAVLNSTTTSLRKLEVENYNLELELAYNDHIASHLELIIENETLQNTEKNFHNLIKRTFEETKSLHEKCKLIETRIRDVKATSSLNNYQDELKDYIKNIQDDLKKNEISFILSKLNKLLNRFNILHCENVLLPKSTEEVEQLTEILHSCYISLQKISDLIECEKLENYTMYYKEFTTTVQEISNFKKILEDEIFNVQSDTLTTCSQLFAQDDI